LTISATAVIVRVRVRSFRLAIRGRVTRVSEAAELADDQAGDQISFGLCVALRMLSITFHLLGSGKEDLLRHDRRNAHVDPLVLCSTSRAALRVLGCRRTILPHTYGLRAFDACSFAIGRLPHV